MVRQPDCVAFLQWCLPRLRMRWPGFRKVHGQVGKRLRRRMRELELPDLAAYRRYLEEHPAEWSGLDAMCRITISRFYRDRGTFDFLGQTGLTALAGRARGAREIRGWSAGCASGEEAYTVKILWELGPAARFPGRRLHLLGTDIDPNLLDRARDASYGRGSLRDVPGRWMERAFLEEGDRWRLRPEFREAVVLRQHDIRQDPPGEAFHLILCRNLVFTYFDEELQRSVLGRILGGLLPGGLLILGRRESLPGDVAGLIPQAGVPGVFWRASPDA